MGWFTGLLIAAAVVAAVVLVHLARRHVVYEFERGLLFRKGVLRRTLDPGAYWTFRPWHAIQKVDVRLRTVNVPGQEVPTADDITVKITIAAAFQVADPVLAVTKVQSFEEALYQELQLALRELVARHPVSELVTKRRELNEALTAAASPRAAAIGLTLQHAGVRDIMFPGKLKELFAQVVQAEKAGQAALVRARSEVAANRALLNAARMLADNPALLTLRTLQAVSEAGKTPGTTLVVGLPSPTLPLTIRSGDEKAALPSTPPAEPEEPQDTPE